MEPQQQPQPQQINEEIKKELLGKENEKSKNSSSDTKSKNWIFQFIKDFAYICFFPFHFLWDLLKIFHSPSREINKQQPIHVITENKSEKLLSSNNQSISDSNTASKTLSTNHNNQLENVACNDNDQTSVKKAISDSNTASKTLSTNHSNNQLENDCFNVAACNDNDHKIKSDQTSVEKVITII